MRLKFLEFSILNETIKWLIFQGFWKFWLDMHLMNLAGMTLLILLKWKKNLLPWIFFVKIERFLLKLVPAIFYQIFIFSLNDSPLKTMKNFFISCKKLFLFSRHSNFCKFPSLPTHSRFKSANGSGIIYDAMNWLA